MIPPLMLYGYGLANAASYIEGKGLRPIGGILDTGILMGSTVGALYFNLEQIFTNSPSALPLTVGLVAGGYTTAKFIIGSPTSVMANFVVGTLFLGPGALALIYEMNSKKKE